MISTIIFHTGKKPSTQTLDMMHDSGKTVSQWEKTSSNWLFTGFTQVQTDVNNCFN